MIERIESDRESGIIKRNPLARRIFGLVEAVCRRLKSGATIENQQTFESKPPPD